MEQGNKWMCPTCRWVVTVRGVDGHATFTSNGAHDNSSKVFPAHQDCEFWKEPAAIDFTKLTKLS